MSSDITGFYIVINSSKSEKSSLFSRIRSYLYKKIITLIYNLRKKLANIIINGHPLCAEPGDDHPTELAQLQHLNYKKLKQIKKLLEDQDKCRYVNGIPIYNPGINASPSSPDTEWKEVREKIGPRNGDLVVIDIDDDEASVDGEVYMRPTSSNITRRELDRVLNGSFEDISENGNYVITQKRIRPKAAKGQRSRVRESTELGTDLEIDDVLNGNFKSKSASSVQNVIFDVSLPGECKSPAEMHKPRIRPKAAKGPRRIDLRQVIDLPLEQMKKTMKVLGYDNHVTPGRRERPMAARKRDKLMVIQEAALDPVLSISPEQHQLGDIVNSTKEKEDVKLELEDVEDEELNFLSVLPQLQMNHAGNTMNANFSCHKKPSY